MSTPNWIPLAGAENTRDLGGTPTYDGRSVQPRRLIRSDNLQHLTGEDVRLLIDTVGVRTIVDLRKLDEVTISGSGPLVGHAAVSFAHHSLYPDAPVSGTDSRAEGTSRISWETIESVDHDDAWTGHYLTYLTMRPDSIIGSLRAIASSPGAALVHCAAGKDRTGTVVALALLVAGATDEAIVADYAASAERVPRILDRLREHPAYRHSLTGATVANQTPKPETMSYFLTAIRDRFGGADGYLGGHGWTASDTARLRAKLLDDRDVVGGAG